MVLIYSTCALVSGFVLDMLFGDPHFLPHIVRGIGKLIALAEKKMRRILPKTVFCEKIGGICLVFIIILIFTGIPFIILFLSYRLSPLLGYAFESVLCYQLLAAKSLKSESMKVYHSLQSGDIVEARKNLSMIVGRDTAKLSKDGIIRAAVETVAENTSDGVTAPLIYIAFGGAVLGNFYKAVNTMDSMIGYKNEKYLYFGRAAAKTDDFFNFIPARICALLMIISAYILKLDGKNAVKIWKRDRRKHDSPNSAQSESVAAGALRIQLAGPASYFGKIYDKPYIGDNLRPICDNDIIKVNRMMYFTAILMLILSVLFRTFLIGVIFDGTL